MIKKNITAAILILLGSVIVHAQVPVYQINDIASAFRQYKDIGVVNIKVPTVVEVPFEGEAWARLNFVVLNQTTNSFEPNFFRYETFSNRTPLSISAAPVVYSANRMVDNNLKTFSDFPFAENAANETQIVINSASPITSSGLTILLENYVALPTTIQISANVEGADKIVVARRALTGETVNFPRTTSNVWKVTLSYAQPLRITELRINEENPAKLSSNGLRFLALPNNVYRVYFNSDRNVNPPVPESGNLSLNQDILLLLPVPSKSNPSYTMADVDRDAIPDIGDNCVNESNPGQEDINGNGRGDACDDFDRDGLMNSKDNCVNEPNRDQSDKDGDRIGDACDKEESRITEKYSWLPWLGIGFAATILIILFVITAKAPRADISQTK